ncbi:ABC transporter permease subunit [Streptomyces sp. 549]|uniref:ABC transporter permease subunit n=1 Tax=Streptomyces sp. 549 TaxID=3049076 RepID=UPI0024C24901|nr:ABC transporter permease subunit [Streptomyces sp. 549]MDK1472030.1 ABC transporter permease subunit [Streptomyces sp. 549]
MRPLTARTAGTVAALWRVGLAGLLLCGIALLPWLSRTDPALTVLRARTLERDPDPEALAAIRRELGLDAGPFPLLAQWFGGLLRGDAGSSWISGGEVLPEVVQAAGASLLLVAGALAVAACVAGAVSARTLWRGATRRGPRPQRGGTAAVLAAVPEFLTASVLAVVVGVTWGWLPALGWYGPQWMVLPALSLGLPAGAFLGRMLDDALPGAFAEPWARTAAAHGVPGRRVARHAVRRCVPGVLPNAGLFVVGLTGGSVAVEQIFDIPGLGRLTLQAAVAQDLPVLQTGALALVALAAAAGVLARLAGRLLLGPALEAGALQSLRPAPRADRRWPVLPLLCGAALLVTTAAGLLRDPLAVDTSVRLEAPSRAHPLGTDALGRDLLARVAHGGLDTLLLAVTLSAVALVVGVALGLFPRFSAGLVETVNAVPAVLAGLLVTGVLGRGQHTAVIAVAVVAWAPLAAHTTALLTQERAATHLTASAALGAGRGHLLRRHVLPAVLPPVVRHALLRVPSVALALAALSFLGLGTQPPAPEWGLLIAEGHPYAERAPWAVLVPTAALVLLGVLSVGLSTLTPGRRHRSGPTGLGGPGTGALPGHPGLSAGPPAGKPDTRVGEPV